MISVNNICKYFGKQDLFRDVSFTINPGERIALVGANGTGKTTLLRILFGEVQPDSGEVVQKKGLRLGYLPQDIIELRGKKVLQQVMEVDSAVSSVQAEYQTVGHRLEEVKDPEHSVELVHRQSQLLEDLERMGAFDLESRAKQVLAGLGFKEESFQVPVETLSGGWIMRVALARILLSQPDLLLLDEPTNHLDLDSLLWLENYLQNTPSALLLISHDRIFMDRVVQRIFEIEKGVLTPYYGNYSHYLIERDKRRQIQESAFRNQQSKIRQIEDFISRNRYRKDRARQAQSRIKALDQMERVPPPSSDEQKMFFRFPDPPRSGRVVAELTDVEKSFGNNTLYRKLNFSVFRGDRIAFLGPNGAGKSTLLKIIAGEAKPDDGQSALGHNVTIGYFAQHQLDQLSREKTVWDEVFEVAGNRTYGTLRTLLAAFLFHDEDIEKKVSVLSGGEKSRLVLLKMLMGEANFLLLDEPTNHLDIPSRDVLEESLKAFSGTMCMITHDRHLIDAIANKVIYIRDGQFDLFPGNYQDFEQIWKSRIAQGEVKNSPKEVSQAVKKPQDEKRLAAERRNALFRLKAPMKKQLDELEEKIDKAQKEKERVEKILADPDFYRNGAEVQEITQSYRAIQKEIETLTSRWEDTYLKLEEIEANFKE